MFVIFKKLFSIRSSERPRIYNHQLVVGSGYNSKIYNLTPEQENFLKKTPIEIAIERGIVSIVPTGNSVTIYNDYEVLKPQVWENTLLRERWGNDFWKNI